MAERTLAPNYSVNVDTEALLTEHSLAQALKRHRLHLHISQKEAADRMGLPHTTYYSRYEKGAYLPGAKLLAEWCRAMDSQITFDNKGTPHNTTDPEYKPDERGEFPMLVRITFNPRDVLRPRSNNVDGVHIKPDNWFLLNANNIRYLTPDSTQMEAVRLAVYHYWKNMPSSERPSIRMIAEALGIGRKYVEEVLRESFVKVTHAVNIASVAEILDCQVVITEGFHVYGVESVHKDSAFTATLPARVDPNMDNDIVAHRKFGESTARKQVMEALVKMKAKQRKIMERARESGKEQREAAWMGTTTQSPVDLEALDYQHHTNPAPVAPRAAHLTPVASVTYATRSELSTAPEDHGDFFAKMEAALPDPTQTHSPAPLTQAEAPTVAAQPIPVPIIPTNTETPEEEAAAIAKFNAPRAPIDDTPVATISRAQYDQLGALMEKLDAKKKDVGLTPDEQAKYDKLLAVWLDNLGVFN